MKQDRAFRAHERILDVAADEFLRNGYTHTTTQLVASRSGMTKGGLYAHFPSKHALAQAFHDYADEWWADIEHEAGARGGDAAGMLSFKWRALVEDVREDLRLQAAFRLDDDRELGGSPGLLARIRSQLAALTYRAQQDSLLEATCQPELVAHLLLVLALSAPRVPGDAVEARRSMEQLWLLLWTALRRDSPGPERLSQ